MSFKHKTQKRATAAKIRIIGGLWRGRKLPIIDEDGLRPSGDRLRETLFNWLAPHLHRAEVLDCYAGSGALGLEALSRGAHQCSFVELNTRVVDVLRANIEVLGASASVSQGDFLRWTPLDTSAPKTLIFIDPPFAAGLWQASIDHIQSAVALAPDALIYIESPKGQALSIPDNWLLAKEKTIGQIRAALYQHKTAEP